jgi:hypothetical protein
MTEKMIFPKSRGFVIKPIKKNRGVIKSWYKTQAAQHHEHRKELAAIEFYIDELPWLVVIVVDDHDKDTLLSEIRTYCNDSGLDCVNVDDEMILNDPAYHFNDMVSYRFKDETDAMAFKLRFA